MKKRTLLPLILVTLLAISLVGCSSSTQETASKNTASTNTEKAVSEKAKTAQSTSSKNAPAQPGNGAPTMNKGAQPDQADGTRIIGQIVSVSNRTVTLALFAMPSPPANGTKGAAPSSGATPPAGSNPPSGNQPGGQTPQLSGEKKTITIPTTVKIVSGGREGSAEVKINDLKAGQMMMVKLNSSNNAVEEVRVMEQGGMGGPPPGGGGAPGQGSSNSAN